jgi:hypothetical protein
MSIKLVCSDVRGFIQGILGEIAEFERENPPNPPDWPFGACVQEYKEAYKEKVERMALLRRELERVFTETMWNESDKEPCSFSAKGTNPNGDWNGSKFHTIRIRGKCIIFKNAMFDVVGLYTKEEARLLVQKKYEAERSEVDFLKSRSDQTSSNSESGREHIPERIRNEVWRRDGGKCVECGSVFNLEFDHVIPVAKGGSNTARNLRILCESCNRRKSDRMG